MNINETVQKVYTCAKEHGWHETPRSPLEIHALIHSEVSEATEAVRNNKPHLYIQLFDIINGEPKDVVKGEPGFDTYIGMYKPEGEAIELADAVIRIMDYFGSKGWDLEEAIRVKHLYNLRRPYRHGGKAI